MIYFVLGLLSSVELSIGVGFGLFAIFSVLRYHTEETPIREMTYLFVLLALPVMNAVLMPTSAIPQSAGERGGRGGVVRAGTGLELPV